MAVLVIVYVRKYACMLKTTAVLRGADSGMMLIRNDGTSSVIPVRLRLWRGEA